MIGLVLRLPKFLFVMAFLLAFFSYLSTGQESVSDMTYIVSSGTLNLN